MSPGTTRDDDAFIVAEARPCYLDDDVRRTMSERVERARQELADCCACPRD